MFDGPARAATPLLAVEGLKKYFPVRRGLADILTGRPRRVLRAVDGISFEVAEGETLGLVGESGCGKSTAGLAILQLLPDIEGEVRFRGRRIVGLRAEQNRQLRRHMRIERRVGVLQHDLHMPAQFSVPRTPDRGPAG